MVMTDSPFRRATPILLVLLPALVLLAARLATHSEWAAANATLAAMLFAWLVADTLGLAILFRAKRNLDGLRALLGGLSLASLVILIAPAAPVRDALMAMPIILALMTGTVVGWLSWSGVIYRAARRNGAAREAALGRICPPRLVHLALRESHAMRIALFEWRRAPIVPQGASAHRYDGTLAPMLWVFMVAQAIELPLVHFLVSLASERLAWILSALSLAGMLWFLALIKSIRRQPMLIDDDGIYVRSGMLVDLFVPHGAVLAIGETFDGALLKDASTLNLALLSAPNVTMTLARPVSFTSVMGTAKRIERIALRLDEPQRFRDILAERGRP